METILGKRLKMLRTERGDTQENMAEAIGIASRSVSRYEMGKTLPDIEILEKMADYFGVTTDYLLGRTN